MPSIQPTYAEFKEDIAHNRYIADYYEQLHNNARSILEDIHHTNQTQVATSLGLSIPKLSNILPLLKVIAAKDMNGTS